MPRNANQRVEVPNGVTTAIALSTVSSDTASISVNGETFTANVVKGLTLAVNDVVLVARVGSLWYVFAITKTTAPTPELTNPVIPTPKPTVKTGRLTVAPVETRTYRDGKWRTDTDDVLQGSYGGYGNSTGVAFYGSLPRTLAGKTVTAARIRVRRERAGDFAKQTSTLRLGTQRTRPAGNVTLGASTSGPRLAVGETNDSFAIPNSWAQAMVDGTAGSLAVFTSSGAPYMRFAGKSSYGPAWTMTIYWTT
jgi:hypothetical protein